MTASPTPRIPAVHRDGDMVIHPDYIRIHREGWVECGYSGCNWSMDGGTVAEQGEALIAHTREDHKHGGQA